MINWQQRLINPVLNKEFRLRMRTFRSALALLVYLLVIGLFALAFIYINMRGFNGTNSFNPNQSREMFYFISVAQLILIAFMTPGLTAGIISGEREKQTLNMLLTTQQSSSTIIISKLVSSLSFMLLVIIATLPVYSIVFLFGGISPWQLFLVFLFYIFTMIVLGAFGILFSTLFKRTMISVVVTYGVTLFIFGGTGLLYLFFTEIFIRGSSARGVTGGYSWTGFIIGLNPVISLISIFEPDMSKDVFRPRGGNTQNFTPPIRLWLEFVIVYTGLAAVAVFVAIRKIRPNLKMPKPKVK